MSPSIGNMDPRIGILIREGRRVFYAYPNGYRAPPVEGSIEKVQRSLLAPSSTSVGTLPGDRRTTKGPRLHAYVVTVSPRITVYAGTCTFGNYEVTVSARNAQEACRMVRKDRRREDGCMVVPAQFRAKRLTDD